jgi:hypothetical protein
MNADPIAMIPALSERLGLTRQSRGLLDGELLEIERLLGGLMETVDSVSRRLEDLKANPSHRRAVPAGGHEGAVLGPNISLDDFRGLVEKILQGSLESVGDKISARIVNMIRGLKGLGEQEREARIREIKEAADSQMVDLSSLYAHKEVESNLDEIGVEEKESKGIESSLEKLRKLRGKTGPGHAAGRKDG